MAAAFQGWDGAAGVIPAPLGSSWLSRNSDPCWDVTVFTLASLWESPPRGSLQTSCFGGNPHCEGRIGNREGFPRRLKIRIWSWEGSGGFELRDG